MILATLGSASDSPGEKTINPETLITPGKELGEVTVAVRSAIDSGKKISRLYQLQRPPSLLMDLGQHVSDLRGGGPRAARGKRPRGSVIQVPGRTSDENPQYCLEHCHPTGDL